jgi:hypothetical protein
VTGTPAAIIRCLGGVLQAHRTDRVRPGANPDEPRIDHGLREIGILREETVSRVNRFRAGRLGGRDDLLADQIGFAGRGGADMHGFVGLADMERRASASE